MVISQKDTRLRVMICQACGNPQSSASSLRGTPTAAWIKKYREHCSRYFLSMGYKKNILGSFAYEFGLLLCLVKSFACAHGEIIYSVNCEI